MKRITQIVQEKLVMMMQPEFDFDISERISVVSDLEHYKASEDPFVHAQKQGKIPNYYEVYWDNEWIMDFHEGDQPKMVYLGFLKGFGKAYEQGKVRLNPLLAEAEKANDLEAMIKNRQVEAMKEKISQAMEVDGGDYASAEEQAMAEQITKSIEEARNESNKITT